MNALLRPTFACGILLAGLSGCKDLAGSPPLPAGTVSPGIVQNLSGAVQTAVAANVVFQLAFAGYIPISGMLTDELQYNSRDNAFLNNGTINTSTYGAIVVDARQLDQADDWNPPLASYTVATDTVFGRLQLARALAYQAIGGLAAYAPDSVVLRGEMYARLGYAEILLADLFCSGVPLSTLDFQGDYTFQPGATTAQVYQHAIAVFDTAIALAEHNTQVTNLAKVGQGRAYLALGEYAAAGQAVSTVSTTFQFLDSVITCGPLGSPCPAQPVNNTLQSARFCLNCNTSNAFSVGDREGETGLPFVSSGDPRTVDTVVGQSREKTAQDYYPKKYPTTGIDALLLASGVEAQLITAEADLNAGDAAGMFTILNALRKSNAATAGMPTLTDPQTFGAELDTLFTERAAWLFIDGHRQGDLRRLMRNYVSGQGVQVVANQYPIGDYGYGVGPYGNNIDAPVPASELSNPSFTGCLSRD